MRRHDVLAYPHQIGDALWRIEAAGVPRRSHAVEVCGEAFGTGELAGEMLGDRAAADVGNPLVLCISYSGDDEETLSCFEEAGRRGVARAVVCTSGKLAARAREEGVPVIGVPAGIDDPRAAIVYFVLAAAVLAEPSIAAAAEAAVPALTGLVENPDQGVPEGAPPVERALGELLLQDLSAAS